MAAIIRFIFGIEYKGDFILPPTLLCLTIYAIGFYALKQPDIFRDISIETVRTDDMSAELPVTPVNASSPIQSSQMNQPTEYEYPKLTPHEETDTSAELPVTSVNASSPIQSSQMNQPASKLTHQEETVRTDDMSAESPVNASPIQSSRINQPAKYEYSKLTSDELTAYGEKLLEYLERKKPYLDNDLKLQDIADTMGLPSYHLSQIINTQLNRNFYDLINSYRIEEAKRQLSDPDKHDLKILAIAFEAGFNSKSAFNVAFKKYTNITPSRYRQSQLNPMNS